MEIIRNLNKNTNDYAKNLLGSAIKEFINQEYIRCRNLLNEAKEIFKSNSCGAEMAMCFALEGVLNYLKSNDNYDEVISLLADAKYLAAYSQDATSKLVVEYFTGLINEWERNVEVATSCYTNAKNLAIKEDEYNLLDFIIKGLENLSKISSGLLMNRKDPLVALVKIGQTVSAETSVDALLRVITEETKNAIEADRCTVFLYDKEHNEIWSKVALGLENSEIRFPADKGLAGHVIKTGETINIKDAYNDVRFNSEIDKQTGYRTKNILCMPIKNLQQEIIGAFQVLNKKEGCFSAEDEDLLVAIGSSAGIALENAQLFEKQTAMLEEQKIIFESFIETLATSIDARDKITAGHSTRVRMYSSLIAKSFGLEERMIQIIEKAATLHDIGKIGIRDSVLQKDGKLTDEEYRHIQEHVSITHDILSKIHMSDDFKLVTEIACSHHEKFSGHGYYRDLAGDQIPFGGRILAVSDVFDAITSKRHYRDKMPIKKVIEILLKDSGTHFDSTVVEEFLKLYCDAIIKVFLTENHLELKKEDEVVLARYNMRNLYDLLCKEPDELTDDEQNIISLFNTYYYGYDAKKDSENA